MKPLIVFLSVFVLSLLVIKLIRGSYEYGLPGRIALSAMLLFTAIGHFAFTEGMAMMIPPFVPMKTEVVIITGVLEIAAAIGLLVPGLRTITAWMLIAFFILILPANIYAAINRIDYQTGTFDGAGLAYLWLRVPLQVLFIGWSYLSSIKS